MKEEWCVSKLIWEFISPRIAFHFKLKTSLSSVHRFSQWFWYEEQEGVLRSYMALSNNYRQLKTESKFAGNFLFLKGHITRVIIRACRCTGIWQWTMNREIFPKIWIIFEQCPTFVFLPRVVGRTETKAPPGTRRVYAAPGILKCVSIGPTEAELHRVQRGIHRYGATTVDSNKWCFHNHSIISESLYNSTWAYL